MAAKCTAHPDTRLIEITEAPVDGLQDLNVIEDIYSPLKDDWHSTPSLQKLQFPLREQIGQNTGRGQIGPYVFLFNQDGWRIQPYDADHELSFSGGNLLGQAAVEGLSFPMFVSRPGRTIIVPQYLSAQALTRDIPTSGLTHNEAGMLNEFWHVMCMRMETDETTGMCYIRNMAGDIVMQANVWEDVAGTIPYRGQGIARRDPFMTPP